MKAINAARMALRGDGTYHVSLDQVIKTMRETGAGDMTKYKETSRGGLAVKSWSASAARASLRNRQQKAPVTQVLLAGRITRTPASAVDLRIADQS